MLQRGSLRDAATMTSRGLAFVMLAAAVVLSPFRAAVLLAAQPRPPLYAGYTDFSVSWAEVAALAGVALWGINLLARPRRIAVGPRLLWLPAAGLLVLAWASAAWSVDPVISAENAGTLTVLFAFALYVLNEVRLERILPLVAAMAAIQAVVAIGQAFTQRSLGLSWLGELTLDPAIRGVSVVATSDSDRLLRAYGLADHPNILGGLLAFSLPLLAVALIRQRQAVGLTFAAAFVVAAAALFLTFSRGAWLAVVAALGLELVMLARVRLGAQATRLALVGAAAALVVAALVAQDARYVLVRADVLNPQVSTEAMSTGERAILLQVATTAIAAHPVLGTGLATAATAILAAMPSLDFDAQPAASAIVDVAVELGLIGVLCYLAIALAPWLVIARRSVRWTPELIATSAALLAWTVVGLFDYYTWSFPAGRVWSVLLLGLWAGAVRDAQAQVGQASRAETSVSMDPARG
jgi:putative inorganic carbon (HCO3(-)) transporter